MIRKQDGRSVAEFIGRSVEHAEKYISPVRVYSEDGRSYIVKTDYCAWRLNVKLENRVVVDAFWG